MCPPFSLPSLSPYLFTFQYSIPRSSFFPSLALALLAVASLSSSHSPPFIPTLRTALRAVLSLPLPQCPLMPPFPSLLTLLLPVAQAKIADFGLLRRLTEGDSQLGAVTRVAGTPGYMDPDYTRTRRLTTRSDVYW